jgi:hypothetical protein
LVLTAAIGYVCNVDAASFLKGNHSSHQWHLSKVEVEGISGNASRSQQQAGKMAYAFLYWQAQWKGKRSCFAASNLTQFFNQPCIDEYSSECGLLVGLNALIEARAKSGKADHKVDLVVMHADTMPLELQKTLTALGVRSVRIQPANTKGAGNGADPRYHSSLNKLRAAELFEYDRVIFLEMDFLPLRSLDFLFDMFDDIEVPYAAPRMYWLQKGESQAGPFIVSPRHIFWQKYFAPVLDVGTHSYPGDNDWTNEEFSGEEPLLPGFLALLVAEWIPGDRVEGWWGSYFNQSPTL